THLTQHFRDHGYKVRPLTVSHAFHSPHMNPILEQFQQAISDLTYTPPTIPFISDLTGQPAGSEIDAAYWTRHLRNPVRFTDATTTLHDNGITTFIEIGPDGVLSGLIRETLDHEPDLIAVPVLRRDHPEPH
ncbi:acyltransferase domain-containing protein, partial [Microbispora sp. CSR-4]